MVNAFVIALAIQHTQQSSESVLERLDPPRRMAVLMALLGVLLVGLMLVMIVMVGAKWVRRLARHEAGQRATMTSGQQDSSGRPRDALRDVLPETNVGETIRLNISSGETKMEP